MDLMPTSVPDPADVTLDAYYFKPAKALFHAIELEAYRRAELRLTGPLLDLGCGDGRMTEMLRRRGVMAEPPACGLDILEPDVRRAHRQRVHAASLCGDACRLPFRDGSFRTVVANGLLSAVPGSPHVPLAEIRRVLLPGGTFVATMPTVRVRADLWPSAGAARLPLGLRRWINARFERAWQSTEDGAVLEVAGWTRTIGEAGFDPFTVVPFLGPRAAAMCILLAVQPLRIFSALRAAPGFGRKLTATLLERHFRRLIEADAATNADAAGYVLVAARRR